MQSLSGDERVLTQKMIDAVSAGQANILENEQLAAQATDVSLAKSAQINDLTRREGGADIVASLDGTQKTLSLGAESLKTLASLTISGTKPSNSDVPMSIPGAVMGALVVNSLAAAKKQGQAPQDTPVTEKKPEYGDAQRDLADISAGAMSGGEVAAALTERQAYAERFAGNARDILGVPLGGAGVDLNKSAVYAQAGGDLKGVVQASMNKLVRNELEGKAGLADVNPLVSLVANQKFQGFAQKLFGADTTKKLNLNVAGAVIASNPGIGSKALSLVKATVDGAGKTSDFKPDVNEWVEMARWITTEPRTREFKMAGKPVEEWIKGRKELEAWLTTLASLKSADLLKRVQMPFGEVAQAEIKKAESAALTSLDRLANAATTSGQSEVVKRERARLRSLAKSSLDSYGSSLDDLESRVAVLVEALRHDTDRDVWRRYEKGNYLIYRRAVGYLVFASRMAGAKRKFSSLGTLITASFQELEKRQKIAQQKRRESNIVDTEKLRAPASLVGFGAPLSFDEAD